MLSRYANHTIRESTYKEPLRIYYLTCLERKRKEIQDELQQNDTDDDDDDDDILFRASSSGVVKNLIGLNMNITNRDIIIVEDIVDTGDTMEYLLKELKEKNPASVKLATMVFKPAALKHDLKPDYVGFEVPPDFLVGYGLDYDGLGRNLNDIYTLKG